jgi:hypothetical protein
VPSLHPSEQLNFTSLLKRASSVRAVPKTLDNPNLIMFVFFVVGFVFIGKCALRSDGAHDESTLMSNTIRAQWKGNQRQTFITFPPLSNQYLWRSFFFSVHIKINSIRSQNLPNISHTMFSFELNNVSVQNSENFEKLKCDIEFGGTRSYQSCVSFLNVTNLFLSPISGQLSTQSLSVRVVLNPSFRNISIMGSKITARLELDGFVSPFSRWRRGITNEMIACCYEEMTSFSNKRAVVYISKNGKNVRAILGNSSKGALSQDSKSSLPSRAVAMEQGIRMAIEYFKEHMTQGAPFPDITALFWVGDDAGFSRLANSRCGNDTADWSAVFFMNILSCLWFIIDSM